MTAQALYVISLIALALALPVLTGRGARRAIMPAWATIAVAVMGLVGYNCRWVHLESPATYPLGIAVIAGFIVWAGLRLDLPRGARRPRTGPGGSAGAASGAAAGGAFALPVASPGFGDVSLREVMTPKAMIAGVARDATARDAVEVAGSSGHSRLVVYDGDLDHVVGTVNIHDFLESYGRTEGIRRLIRPAMFAPESKKCFGMLEWFLREREQFALVLDEFGGTAGVVTVEDLLDELVGEMADEHEREEAPVRRMPDGSYLVPGHMKVDEINEKLGLEIPEGDYETVSGYVLDRLGRVPARGERLSVGKAALEIAVSTVRRIVTIKVVTDREGGDDASPQGD